MASSIPVALAERSYEIVIGRGNLADLGGVVRRQSKAQQAIVITDTNVRRPHAHAAAESLAAAAFRAEVLEAPAGEGSKSIAQAERLWTELGRLKADRRTPIVAVGGGVIGDLAGFVAATYARGLPFFQVPTSLLAQVDSSVGGKVGINLPHAKNIVGAFWQPAAVLIDLAMLETLPEREYQSGLAEVVKYGVILDADFFGFLEANVAGLNARDPAVLEHVVARSCQLKASVVEEDEFERTGKRAALNYGHTFCHAIETVAGYGRFLHGEAVAIGMVCASRLAERVGRVGPDLTDRQRKLLEQLRLPTQVAGLDQDQLLAAMLLDKKTEGGRLRFVLPSRLGHVEVADGIDAALVRQVL